MDKKVFLVTIKENEKLTSFYEAYSSLEKAVAALRKAAKQKDVKLVETELKNEFKVYRDKVFVHTLRIIDVWVR